MWITSAVVRGEDVTVRVALSIMIRHFRVFRFFFAFLVHFLSVDFSAWLTPSYGQETAADGRP